jgi:hypothetical protein
LELDGSASGVRSCIDEFLGDRKITVMVDSDFRHDKGRMSRPDFYTADTYGMTREHLSSVLQ